MTEKEFTIQSYDTNPRSTMRFSSLLKYMQQAAREDSDKCGATYTAMRDVGVVFVLVRSSVELDAVVKCGETIVLRTWQHFIKGISMYRDFVFSRNGIVIGRARTQWVLVDYETRKLRRPNAIPWSLDSTDESCGTDVAQITPPAPPYDREVEGKVTYSLLDENNHLNNALYMDVVEDSLSQHKDISCAHLHYVSELKPEQNFTVRYRTEKNKTDFEIVDKEGKTAFVAEIKYIEES